MGCLFALLAALSSFTVALMPRGNLSHGGGCGIDFFFLTPLLGKEGKGGSGGGVHWWCLARGLSAGYLCRLVICGHFASKLHAELQGSAVSISA